jgi:hypothetical protein
MGTHCEQGGKKNPFPPIRSKEKNLTVHESMLNLSHRQHEISLSKTVFHQKKIA